MFIHFYKPHPLLQEIVNNIMIFHEDLDKTKPPPVNVYPPMPDHCIYFFPRDSLMVHRLETNVKIIKPPSIIIGSQIERFNLSVGYDHLVIRVSFHPGGLHRLLHLPMHEIVGYDLNSENVFANKIKDVNEQLRAINDYHEMKIVVETFLLAELKKATRFDNFDSAMRELLKGDGNVSVDYIAKEACLSFRQFERKCKERIGIPPKLFARIIRFSKAYRMREERPKLRWTSIAYLSGYFDQMHFIRDFKDFAGTTPTMIDKELSQTHLRLQAGPYI